MIEKLVLRRSDYNFYNSYKFYLLAFIFFASFIVFLFWLYQISLKGFNEFLGSSTIPIFLLFGLGNIFYKVWLRKTYIELSDTGIKYISGLPAFLGKFNPDWQKSWQEIQSVSLSDHVTLTNPEFRHFFIRTNDADYKIYPLRWSDPNEKEDSFIYLLKEKLFNKKKYVNRKIKENPLFEIFEDKGLLRANSETSKPESEWTDINSSPIALTMTTIFILSLIFFIIESYFTLTEYYTAAIPYVWFILIGVFTVPIPYYFLKESKLKPKEIAIMSVLVGFGFSMISYPISLRINQWTDKDGLQTYSYTLKEDGRWRPDTLGLGAKHEAPELIFDLIGSKYWKQFKTNDVKEFELRKGGLGFYQINMEPIYEDQRRFYEGSEKKVKTELQVNN